MKEFVISEAQAETAILVGLVTREQNEMKTKEYLDELEFLAHTAGAVVVKRFVQRLDTPLSTTYVGKGKLEEIRAYIESEAEEEREVGMAIFDDELSAKQIRNIEAELKIKILDRTSLILDIFAMRAQTSNAKTQVELAQYKYMLPRLTRLWTHLERQGGGSGSGKGGSVGLRGPGETQLEMDRRIILNRMSLLKNRLADIEKQKNTQRKGRGRLIRVALVGYTNVGKSTLMNLLAKSDVFAENKLFATLDTTVRKVIIDNLPFLLSDTVGFIRKLPTDLVESFKSTLDEVREADLLLHVVDISHPDFEEQIAVVDKTLADIGAGGKPTIIVFNKVDAYTFVKKDDDDLTPRTRENIPLDELKSTWMAKLDDNCIFVSARERLNIDELRRTLYVKVKELHVQKYPYNDFLYDIDDTQV
ncbi:MAG TPA: GTPase HflX [Candidatus Avibacteroides avistercoris]|uniref:GTPase HflX n=1 Tax=Candidatus Avibacteroides avistercoris TaxID=2840690 RepID=A0A9D2UJ63_9BACT|nr:GTPase HflX [Candidatus Avibacteroides avistercoris]